MSEKTKDWWEGTSTERGNLTDSRYDYEQEMTAKNQLQRKGAYIDWKTGRIYAKEFIGDGQGLWNVGEGTGTGPRGEPGPQGEKGDKGDPGDPGADGKDYDPSALDDLQRQININTTQSKTNKEDIEGLQSEISVNKSAIQRHEEMIKGNTAKIATNSSDIFDLQQAVDNIEIPETDLTGYATEEYVDTAIDAIEFPETDLSGINADIDAIKAEQTTQDSKILANENAIEENKKDIIGLAEDIEAIDIPSIDGLATEEWVNSQIDAIDIPEVDVSDKASLSDENTFNGKQTFNKNLTVKGAETSIIPTFNSRWHKFSVNPPKNEDGSNNTSEAYGVNYWLDAGNTWKNQFRISNRNGVAFEVRGGSDLNGQLHSQWTYSGPQTDDNNIATVKYVKDAVEGINIPDVDLTGYATEDYVQEEINKIDIPETDLSDYMTEDETVEFVDTMNKLTLANAKLDAAEQDRNYAVPLAGNSTKTGKLVLKTNEGTPFEIQSGNGTPIFKMWSSGAVSMLKDYSEFKDNELVTKSYVDNGTVAISGAQTRTSGILTLQESSGKVFQVKKGNDITAELWADGTFITTRTDFSNNHLVSKAYVDDKVGSGGGSGFTQGDRVCATSAGATDVGGFYIENGNLYCKVN
jgi:hypothetical protein